jgi:hypothetical protein
MSDERKYTSFGWQQGNLFSHYGVILEADKPTTGVISTGSVAYIDEEICSVDAIDLAWEEHLSECQGMCGNCHCNHEGGECSCHFPLWGARDWHAKTRDHEYDPTDDHDGCGPEERGTTLIGSWKKDEQGLYVPDPQAVGAEYAAIVGETNIQVVWSKYTKRCAGCSPCYPGQGDLNTPPGQYGNLLCYTLPPDLIGGGGEDGDNIFADKLEDE